MNWSRLTKNRALLSWASHNMYLCWLALLVLQALSQAGLGKSILPKQLAKVHLDWVLQYDVVLICHQDVVNETKCTSLQHQHELVVNACCFQQDRISKKQAFRWHVSETMQRKKSQEEEQHGFEIDFCTSRGTCPPIPFFSIHVKTHVFCVIQRIQCQPVLQNLLCNFSACNAKSPQIAVSSDVCCVGKGGKDGLQGGFEKRGGGQMRG